MEDLGTERTENQNHENTPPAKPSFKSFLLSGIFFKNLLAALLLSVLLIFVVDFSLKLYTDHGNAYPIPNLVGVHASKLDSIVEAHQMRYRIIDSAFNYKLPKATVVSQTPTHRFKAKHNRLINIIINSSHSRAVKAPNLINTRLAHAQKTLEARSLRLGKVNYRPHISKGVIIKQSIEGVAVEPYSLILENSLVDLTIGTGLGTKKVAVPNLKGLSLEEAIDALDARQLNIGAVVKQSEQDSVDLIITRQNPGNQFRTQVREGSSIDVWVEELAIEVNPDEEEMTDIVAE